MTRDDRTMSRAYLVAAGTTGLLAFGIPLFLSPLRWARALRWRVPAETDLTVYLGRSLGAVADALSAGSLRAAHRMGFTGLRGEVFIDPAAMNQATKRRPAVYGAHLHRQGLRPGIRGGTRAFYQQTVEFDGPGILKRGGAILKGGLPK